MKRNELRKSAKDQPARPVAAETMSDNLDDTDLKTYESSAEFYERRWQQKIKYDQRDWWIAVAVYTLLASVAFVVL